MDHSFLRYALAGVDLAGNNVLSSFQLSPEFSLSHPPDTNIAKIRCQGSSARDSILLQRELNQSHFHWLECIFSPFYRHVAWKANHSQKSSPTGPDVRQENPSLETDTAAARSEDWKVRRQTRVVRVYSL